MRSMGMCRSCRGATVPTQYLCQVRAAVLQHLVEGSAAFVVLAARVGTVFDEKLDDLLAVPRVPEWIVQGGQSGIVSGVHALRILTQQGAHAVEPAELDSLA